MMGLLAIIGKIAYIIALGYIFYQIIHVIMLCHKNNDNERTEKYQSQWEELLNGKNKKKEIEKK